MGLHIAARLESLSEAGGICISGTAYDDVKNKLPLGYQYLGEQIVKNIAEPVRVYRVSMEPEAVGKVIGEKNAKPKQWQRTTMGLVIVIIVVAAAVMIWKKYISPATQPQVISKKKITAPLPEKPSATMPPLAEVPAKEKMAVEVCSKRKNCFPTTRKGFKNSNSSSSQDGSRLQRKDGFSLARLPSIAVLPFVNMSNDPKQEFFSDGITENHH